MENQIDITYFKGLISIPNLNKDDGDDFNTTYINNFQKEYFINVLGYGMFKDFETALAGSPAAKWTALLNGADYTVDINGITKTTRWNGFKNTKKVSPISDYIYFYWLRDNYAQLTGTGVAISNKENATNYPNKTKSINAWNRHVNLSGNIKDYIYKSSYYNFEKYENSKYLGDDLNFIDDSVKLDESLFMYLYHNRTDFTNWIFTNNEKINALGL